MRHWIMLKTNSKQVKEKIDAYILASFRDYAQREAEAEKLMTSLLYRALDPFIFRHFGRAIDLEKLNRGE